MTYYVFVIIILVLSYVYINYVYIILYSSSVFRASSADQHAARWSTVSVWSDNLVRSSLRCALLDSRSRSVRLEHVEPDWSSPGRRIGGPGGPGVVQQVSMSLYLGRALVW